ncbi:ComEA family DNA-binding protein [Sciscionella sediminilitoris]|uniref:ComEA family DNA-binding protein n=1 Tax=Sciscionella sediminilitoris TaxID=1445613 RepID=UPI001E5FFB55|nr:ComEA family DNA-binding protein [Sciscionella sp. SE31]
MEENDERERLLGKVFAARAASLVQRFIPSAVAGFRPGRAGMIAVVAAVLLGLGVLGVLAFARATPSAESPPPLPAVVTSSSSSSPPPSQVVVSVVGKVAKAGLVRLPDGARVADAIGAAGGALRGVDITKINLARRVSDGEQLFVGIPTPDWARQGPAQPAPAGQSAAPEGNTGQGGSAAKLDLNSATAEQLDQLPGVGEVTAKHILDWRSQHGRFTTVAQLQDVGGIGETRFARLKDLVTVR